MNWGDDTADWKSRPYRPGDENEIARLASLVYPDIDPREYVRLWKTKYLRCPKGFVSWVAEADGVLVGHYGALVTAAKLAGGSILVAQAVDAFTHPQWRRQGIFVGLGRVLLDDLGRRGIHVTYGIPNKAAMPGHEKLSWEVIAEIPRCITFLDKARALRSYRGSRWRVLALRVASSLFSRRRPGDVSEDDESSGPPEAWAAIQSTWSEVMAGYGFAVDRNSEYLGWRYPIDSERRYMAFHKRAGGRIAAGSMCGMTPSGVGQIAEMIFEQGRESEARSVLRTTVSHLRKSGCHTVEALASNDSLVRLFKSEGFFRVSRVLLIAHANDVEGTSQVGLLKRAGRIMLSYGDSDLA